MPDYVIFDPSSTPVTNLVTQIIRSFDEGKEATLGANRVKNPNLGSVNINNPMRWNGTAVVNLTQPEIDSINAASAAASLAALKQAAKDIFLVPSGAQNHAIALGFETLRDMMLSEINLLRAASVPPLTARTITQFNNTFRTTYESKIDALS